MNIKKGDTVVILAGRDRGDAGKPKTGKVLAVFPKENRLLVEGVNMIARHTRPTQRNQKGGIIKKESTIHRSNVAIYCKTCAGPSKVSYKMLDEKDKKEKKLRICRKCGEAI